MALSHEPEFFFQAGPDPTCQRLPISGRGQSDRGQWDPRGPPSVDTHNPKSGALRLGIYKSPWRWRVTAFQPDPFGFIDSIEASPPDRTLLDPPVLLEEIGQRLEAYVPRKVSGDIWRMIRELVLDAVHRSHAGSPSSLNQRLNYTSRLYAYAAKVGRTMDHETVFHPEFVGRFVRQMQADGVPEPTVRTAKWVLETMGPIVTVKAPWVPSVTAARSNAQLPYSESEITRYIHGATAQATLVRGNQACIVIGLGAGAGLRSAEVHSFAEEDLLHDGSRWAVAVRGPLERQVRIDARFAGLVGDGLTGEGGRVFPPHKNAVGDAIARLKLGQTLPKLSVIRLRNTWIDSQLDTLTVTQLDSAAGGLSERVLIDLLRRRNTSGVLC